jgi:hypothetical protein
MMTIGYPSIGTAGVLAMDGQRSVLPTGMGIRASVLQGGWADAGGARRGFTQQTVQFPRDCSVYLHPVRSSEVDGLENKPRSPRTDQQR